MVSTTTDQPSTAMGAQILLAAPLKIPIPTDNEGYSSLDFSKILKPNLLNNAPKVGYNEEYKNYHKKYNKTEERKTDSKEGGNGYMGTGTLPKVFSSGKVVGKGGEWKEVNRKGKDKDITKENHGGKGERSVVLPAATNQYAALEDIDDTREQHTANINNKEEGATDVGRDDQQVKVLDAKETSNKNNGSTHSTSKEEISTKIRKTIKQTDSISIAMENINKEDLGESQVEGGVMSDEQIEEDDSDRSRGMKCIEEHHTNM
ncbi:hypothetical protein HAX54_006175 [Datura stramonium]|uniref:Uncharacterized protein n=1 Tax=Datura stramonium TaxID=4076 RepID=A0ABS8WVX6_DATST|nr:hypothetical protein [Datura stramonium]